MRFDFWDMFVVYLATFSNIPCGMEFTIFISSLFFFLVFSLIYNRIRGISVWYTIHQESNEREKTEPKLWTMNTSPLNIVYRMISESWFCLMASPGYGFETVYHIFLFSVRIHISSFMNQYVFGYIHLWLPISAFLAPYGIPDYPNIICRQSFENENFLFYLCAAYFINNDKNARFSFCHINRTIFIAPRVYITTAILFYQMMKKRDEKSPSNALKVDGVDCTLILNSAMFIVQCSA